MNKTAIAVLASGALIGLAACSSGAVSTPAKPGSHAAMIKRNHVLPRVSASPFADQNPLLHLRKDAR